MGVTPSEAYRKPSGGGPSGALRDGYRPPWAGAARASPRAVDEEPRQPIARSSWSAPTRRWHDQQRFAPGRPGATLPTGRRRRAARPKHPPAGSGDAQMFASGPRPGKGLSCEVASGLTRSWTCRARR